VWEFVFHVLDHQVKICIDHAYGMDLSVRVTAMAPILPICLSESSIALPSRSYIYYRLLCGKVHCFAHSRKS
jgi:hypothetical protein